MTYKTNFGLILELELKTEIQVWTDLKYKARRHAALLRADHLKTGNKPKDEPALNDMEKKILTIIGPESAEGYCLADSVLERQVRLIIGM
uniref:Uncharacterized protein n=1 Tax=Timema cristinae TaxID=61476 RepID=A0A7R9DQ77_TIMCR|nr:unnamed protein product [Timema cristinae]